MLSIQRVHTLNISTHLSIRFCLDSSTNQTGETHHKETQDIPPPFFPLSAMKPRDSNLSHQHNGSWMPQSGLIDSSWILRKILVAQRFTNRDPMLTKPSVFSKFPPFSKYDVFFTFEPLSSSVIYIWASETSILWNYVKNRRTNQGPTHIYQLVVSFAN